MTHLSAQTETRSVATNKRGALCTALLTAALVGAPLMLSSCGFHLRGYDSPMTYAVQSTRLSLNDNDPTSFRLKQPLTQRLNAVGINVVDDIGRQINSSDKQYTSTIRVENIRLKRYELVGVLTEVRLVLSADVFYETLNNTQGQPNEPMTVKNQVQVERTYQFDEASVSTDDKQGKQIEEWLYRNLAQRITDQYVALNLPRVAPEAKPDDSKIAVLVPTDSASADTESTP
ncbi:MAG TPA: hypothetical protein DCQ89_05355 [Psychrobacter sp.]|uniref:Lipopolysaccharide-assembly n=1 Tax=Psychrobacter pasteurii TaxID=1945520 RepID=A0A1R4EC50_9GAMM|nr:hypothetical protein [Psychrobacter pasteurii]SJM36091.1 Lipopolysaccharide-assembly [Psychrobacter pasteurii]HAO59762.1 hypothetical protein [Psychrobacter sp.]